MNEKIDEQILDLLCKQAAGGLTSAEEKELLELEGGVDNSFYKHTLELTAAAIGMIGVSPAEKMPDHLKSAILSQADEHFARKRSVEQPAIALVAKTRDPIWGWLGWACAAAISLLLIANIWVTRSNKIEVAEDLPTATPEILTPAQSRERLVASASDIVKAEWGAGNMKDVAVAGDVVWSDAMQEGYVRLKGLPKNDASQSTYQLWIFEENQGKKTPIDGGTFNINSDGEVVIPIDAHLKAKNPGAFAVTIEKPGGVVVSEQGKVPTLAPVKPKSA